MKISGSFLIAAAFVALQYFIAPSALCQAVLLNADGPGNTYELINGAFDPGNSAVENPECVHGSFGRHVAEVWDAEQGKYVFEFYSHLNQDNDRCLYFDRQRIEVTTTPSSPANLKTTTGETVTYKWRFRVPQGFQPSSSFTHFHQVKAVAGDEGSPIFTLTARKGTPNNLELIHVLDSNSGTSKLAIVPLSVIEGIWVEATEIIKAGTAGTFSIIIRKVSDGTVLFSYNNNNILTERPSNSFIRPKWGIYRSITSPADLRDEILRFSDLTIAEGAVPLAANTYYWKGGASGNFSSASNWNSQLNGSGTSRSVTGALPDDILIIDGSNIGGSTPATGPVTMTMSSNTIGQLIVQNNADVFFQRSTPVAPSTPGTGTLTIAGDGTSAPDFVVTQGSKLTLNSPATDGNVYIALSANVTGRVGGSITLGNTGLHRITSQVTNGLEFLAGATFTAGATPDITASNYPFGSSSQGVQDGVVFRRGSNLVVSGNRSPFGGTSTFQSCNMETGSNFYLRSSNAGNPGNYSNLKSFGNVFVQNGATFTSDGPFFKIDTLTIDAGAAMITHTSGSTPVLGNLLVNGSLSSPSATSGTNTLVMAGHVPQEISGSGSISVSSFLVGNNSNVRLNKTLNVNNSCSIYGKVDFGTAGKISGTGTFTAKTDESAASLTGDLTAGSNRITNVVGTIGSINGLRVIGSGINAPTHAISSSSSNAIIVLSKPALSSATGVVFNFVSDTATLQTANPNGMDTLTGSVVVTGFKSFESGINYIIDGATTRPFGISSGYNLNYIRSGFVEINAPVTVNLWPNILSRLTINSKMTLRPLDTVRIYPRAVINGNTGTNNYIVTGYDAVTGSQSLVRVDSVTASVNIPIGTPGNYLPLTYAPSGATSLAASVFEGITTNGTITGTPLTAGARQSVVNAVWNIKRLSGTGSSTLQLRWPDALEGATFSTSASSDIGLIENSGSAWSAPSGTGDNTANTVTKTITTYGPFSVGSSPAVVAFVFNPIPAKTYGNADFNGGASSLNTTQPIVYSSSNTAVATIVGGSIHIVAAGTCNITASQASDGTYPAASVTQPLLVNKASLTIRADNKTKSQGDNNPPLTASYSGFVLGETSAVLTTQPVLSTTALVSSPAGTYPITASGAAALNYTITYAAGTLTIVPRQNQVITFNPLPVKTYGNADFVIGATSTNTTIPITYVSSNPAVATIVGSNIRITGAGTADITASQAGSTGYFPATDVTRTFTVNKAALTVKVADTVKNQGQPNPLFRLIYTGFVNGDTESSLTSAPVVSTTAQTGSPLGYYVITPEGASSGNYAFIYVSGRLTIFPPGGNSGQYFNAYMSNPNTIVLNVYSATAALGDVLVLDMQGRQVLRKNLFVPAGFISSTLQVPSLAQGAYVLVLRGSGLDLSTRILVLK
jgi:hypothetical protein